MTDRPPGEARLTGVKVLVTRPRERSAELCFLLEDEGARVQELPMLEFAGPDDDRPLTAAAERIGRFQWVLFTSPSAVDALYDAVRRAGTGDQLRRVRLGAVGPRTARAVVDRGLEVAVQAERADGPGLFAALRSELEPGDELLLPVAQEGRPELEAHLRDAGYRVSRVAAYRSAAAELSEEAVAALRTSPPEVILFASPRTAEAFLSSVGEGARELLQSAKLVAIGPTTAGALVELGFEVAAVAQSPTAEGLVEATVAAARGDSRLQ
jgi:uroporphyrinogen-III synthase